MKRPLIGIVGMSFNDSRHFGASTNNLEYINKFGDPIIIMPHQTEVCCDVLYLGGGQDLAPISYGKLPEYHTGNPNVFQQTFYDTILDKYIEAKIPIVGVCLGFQQLGVKFNCKLTQDLKFHPDSPDRFKPGHEVHTHLGGKNKKFIVNSHHHQGITIEGFNSDSLELLSWAKDTGDGIIVEGFRHKTLPIVALQHHPEEWFDDFTENLIKQLIQENFYKPQRLLENRLAEV